MSWFPYTQIYFSASRNQEEHGFHTQIQFSTSRNQEEHGFHTQIYFSVLETRRSMVFIHTDILLSIQKLGGAWFLYTDILLSSRNQEEHGFNPHRYTSQHLETRRSNVSIHTDILLSIQKLGGAWFLYTQILSIQKLGGSWFLYTQIYFSSSRNQEEHGFNPHRFTSQHLETRRSMVSIHTDTQHLETRRSMVFIYTDILLSIQKLEGAWFSSIQIYFSASRNQEEHGFYTHRYTSHLLETRRSMVFIHKDILLSIQKQEGTWFPSTQIYF